MVANTLSRRHSLVSILDVGVLGFQLMKKHYVDDDENQDHERML